MNYKGLYRNIHYIIDQIRVLLHLQQTKLNYEWYNIHFNIHSKIFFFI